MYSAFRIISLFFTRIVDSAGLFKSSLFLILFPIILSSSMVSLGFRVTDDLLGIIIPAVAILVGFSLNTVVLLLRYSENSDASRGLVSKVRTFSVYSILLGIIILTITIGMIIWNSSEVVITLPGYWYPLSSVAVFFLLSHYLFVILLLPPRVSVIVER